MNRRWLDDDEIDIATCKCDDCGTLFEEEPEYCPLCGMMGSGIVDLGEYDLKRKKELEEKNET